MNQQIKEVTFPPPPAMNFADVSLHLEKMIPADQKKILVPVYRFAIRNKNNIRVGHISFKVGDIPHILYYAGHIGYEIAPHHRGNGYAAKACLALKPFVAQNYDSLIITTDPGNIASVKTILNIGALYLDQVEIPKDNFMRKNHGHRFKRRYVWDLE